MRNPTICQAINEKRLLSIMYKDELRTVEPHAHGVGDDGDAKLRAYQTSSDPNWRIFNVDRIQSLRLLDSTFRGPRPDYKRNDSAMARIYCQL